MGDFQKFELELNKLLTDVESSFEAELSGLPAKDCVRTEHGNDNDVELINYGFTDKCPNDAQLKEELSHAIAGAAQAAGYSVCRRQFK